MAWSKDKSKGIHPAGMAEPGWAERVDEALGEIPHRVLPNAFEGGHEGLAHSFGPGALMALRALVPPPLPKLGGTYTFCPWKLRDRASGKITDACEAHWKGKQALAKYRRHWRRFHQAPVLVQHGTVTGPGWNSAEAREQAEFARRWQLEQAASGGVVLPLTDSERTGLDAMDRINERLRGRRGRG